MPKPYEKLLGYALRILVKKRYTEGEISNKLELFIVKHKLLKEADISQEDLMAQVIDRLKELKYIDDYQFAKDYVTDRIRFRPRGVFLLKMELKKKKIAGEIIEKVFSEINLDEEQVAINLLMSRQRKFEKIPKGKQRAKAYAFLGSKGFNHDAIYKAINRCYNL